MLAASVVVYLLFTLAIGYYSSRKIKNASDFAVAGRKLPFFMSSAALFATWFGSETILGASGEFIKHGLTGVIEEPIGAALCLILIGAFYARKIYRSNQLTFSDLFRERFGAKAELISALVMIPSFFSWIAAQFLALGYIFQTVFGSSLTMGILIAALLVVFYTVLGGMWAVSITDTVQMTVIIIGLLIVLFMLINQAEGIDPFANLPDDHFSLVNKRVLSSWEWLAAWITVGLGSIASQDIFQRVIASKNEKVAVQSAFFSGILYLIIGFVPLFIGLIGSGIYPELYKAYPTNFISTLILLKTPVWIKIVFFGALISAILSTASGALLAPATILAENILKPRFKNYDLLAMMRWSVLILALISIGLAFYNQSIFELVGLASSFGLVSLFIPFTFTLFVKNTNAIGVIFGMLGGLMSWAVAEYLQTEIPGIFYGLFVSLIGILAGMFFFKQSAAK
jgi:solute:Na+ symporter, SSS family